MKHPKDKPSPGGFRPASLTQDSDQSAIPPSNKDGDIFYAEWFNKQTLAKQKELTDAGLHPMHNGQVDSNYVFSVQEEHKAYGFTKPEYPQEEPSKPLRMYDQDEVEIIIRRVVMAMQLTESPEVLFQARCILIAFGIGDPPTETELARIKGCSRQFVSKKVKRIQQLFNLTPSQFMRSEAACKAYADAWQKTHKKANNQQPNKTNIPS